MANKPTKPNFPLGLESQEQSVFQEGILNNGVVEHGPDAVMTVPETPDASGVPSAVRYNEDDDQFEGYYNEGGWLPLGGGNGGRWEALPHASSSLLQAGRAYLVDNTDGVSTVLFPSPKRVGDSVTVCDLYGKFSTYPLTVDGNGKSIYGSADSMTISTDNVSATFTWTGEARGWVITSGVGLGQGRVYSREIYSQILSASTPSITLSTQPSIVDVYVDGKRLKESLYTLDGYEVKFDPALASGSDVQIVQYIPIQLGAGGGGSGGTVITWEYNGGSAIGGETQIVLDVVVDSVSEIYIRGSRQQIGRGFTFDPATSTITLADELEAGDDVVVVINGDPTVYNQIDRTPWEVARANNVSNSEVILSTDKQTALDGKTVLYDVLTQKYWGIPLGIPQGAKIKSVDSGSLTYIPGDINVDLSLLGYELLKEQLRTDDPGLGTNLVYGALKQVSITSFMSLADVIRFDNGELVNVDAAIIAAKAAGHEHIYFPNGHFELSSTTALSNIMLIGSNKSQFGDIKLENSDGSSGKLSLETDGSVLHITGDTATNGITLSNSGSGFTSSLIGIVGFSIYYPDQDWKDWVQGTTADIDGDYYYEPTVYPPTFVADVSMRVVFDNLFFINAYHWIDIKNAQLVIFGKIAGSLLNRGYTVTRMAAGGVTENFNSYPFWTWACGFAGISSRVNHYCDAVGKAIQVGLDDGVTRTVEQMRILHAAIIGCADGIICGGKGVSIVDAKIDNVMRGITISDDDNSAYHQIGKAWISSYYRNNYIPKQRRDGNVYGFKSNTATPIDLSGLQVVRADGRGVWMPYSSGSQVGRCIVQQCMYKAFTFGSRGRSTDVISVSGCYAGMYVDTSLTDQVAFSFGDFMRCDIKGLQWKGASNVTPFELNNDLNYYEEGKELDLTSLGGRFYKGYSNTLFTQERGLRGFINSLTTSSTASLEVLRLAGTNTGGKILNVGLGIRNTVSDGTGYGALVLYASLAGTDTPIVEVFGDGVNTGLRPLTDASRDLGDATHRFRRGYFSNSLEVGGNPVGVKVAVPSSATAPGSVGQWAADSSYIYVCIAANTWVRSALSTW